MPKAKCVPCLGRDIKGAILSVLGPGLADILNKIPDCAQPRELQFCSRGTRPRTAYQEFVSGCMKGKNIKGREQAPVAMKACATEWRVQKGRG